LYWRGGFWFTRVRPDQSSECNWYDDNVLIIYISSNTYVPDKIRLGFPRIAIFILQSVIYFNKYNILNISIVFVFFCFFLCYFFPPPPPPQKKKKKNAFRTSNTTFVDLLYIKYFEEELNDAIIKCSLYSITI